MTESVDRTTSMPISRLPQGQEWAQTRVAVIGLDDIGFSEADVALDLGAQVDVVAVEDSDIVRARAKLLETLGARVLWDDILPACDLVLVGGNVSLLCPAVTQALAAGLPLWSDIDLAWSLDAGKTPWLGLAGPGSIDAALALESILAHNQSRASAVGAGLRPILETTLDSETYDALVVRLDAAQLRWMSTVSFHSACVLGVGAGDDVGDVAKVYNQVQHSCVYVVEDPATQSLVEEADVVEGARAIGLTCSVPAISMLGVVDDLLVDRAFIPQRNDSALELVKVSALGDISVLCALGAAVLARSFGVSAMAVRAGLTGPELGVGPE